MSMGKMGGGIGKAARMAAEGEFDENRSLDLGLLKRLFFYTTPHARKRNSLLILVIIRSLQLPLGPAILGWTIGTAIKRTDSAKGVNASIESWTGIQANFSSWGLVVAGVIAFALWALITEFTHHFRYRWATEFGEAIALDMRRDIFLHLQRMPMAFFNRMKLGQIISRMTSDVEYVRMGVQQVLFVSLVQLGQGLGAAVLMFYSDWILFMLILAMLPVLAIINRVFHKRLSRAYRATQESFSRVTSNIAESVSGIRVTQGFVRQDHSAAIFNDLVEDHSNYNVAASKSRGQYLPLLEFNNQFFLAVGIVLVGGYRVLQGWADVEDLIMFFFLAQMFFQPVVVIGMMYDQALSALAGAERVFKLLDTKPDWQDPEDAIDLPPIQGHVAMQDVSFEYVKDRPVLKDVNIDVKPGQVIALVGATGSGKTTIINLISKFYLPTQGRIMIDGHDLKQVSSASLQRQMGIVLQTNFLFTGTVRDNIRMGKQGATDEDIAEACQKLDCLDIFENLSNGFDTDVGEGGNALSLGQRQLVCFARAMVADPRILILDEATSAVDTMTEARIQRSLSILLKDRTSFVVAHRLSTIRHADMVLVLEDGRIVERGSHIELLKEEGIYANLYRKFIKATNE